MATASGRGSARSAACELRLHPGAVGGLGRGHGSKHAVDGVGLERGKEVLSHASLRVRAHGGDEGERCHQVAATIRQVHQRHSAHRHADEVHGAGAGRSDHGVGIIGEVAQRAAASARARQARVAWVVADHAATSGDQAIRKPGREQVAGVAPAWNQEDRRSRSQQLPPERYFAGSFGEHAPTIDLAPFHRVVLREGLEPSVRPIGEGRR